MLKKILSVTVALAICLVLSTVMPLANAAEITGFDGEGTEESPYLIKSAADLQRLAEAVNGGNDCSGIYFKMTDDIDLSGVCGEDIDGEEVSWTPIGGFKVNIRVFSGIFDGNGKNISGLYINAPSGSFQGLFGYIDGGTVKNLNVDGYVNCNGYVGGIAGQNAGGTIENCSNSCAVSNRTNYIGGIVGYNYEGTLRNCSNTGTISGKLTYIGGIVGYQREGSATNCRNTGTVTGNNDAAGIAGVNDRSTITNCYNTGSISSLGGYAGGIAGVSLNGAMGTAIVENCYNTGCISSAYYVGGIVGSFGAGSGTIIVKNCYSTGDTNSTGYVAGGVLGNIYYLQIGILERTYLEIQNCYYQEDKADTALGYDPADDEPKERVTKSINAEARPESSFTFGEMAYLLQSLQEEESGLVWGQRITTKGEHDGSPILTNNEAYRVLKVTFMNGAETLAEQYANPGKLKPPTENLPALPEGYEAGWSADPNGESKIYYDTVPIGNEDTVFYAVIGIPPERPGFTPPEAIENLVYNSTEQELITEGSAEGGTMVYSLSEEGNYSENIPTGTDAGEYTVWYMVEGDEGYRDTEPTPLTVEIAKANPVPPETDLTATVGQTLADIEQQLPEGYAWVNRTQSVGSVGENSFAATFTPSDTENYNILSLMLIVRVTAPEPEPEPQYPDFTPPKARENLVYDRTEQKLITAGSATGGTMVYSLSENEDYSEDIPVGTDAGEYIVWYKVAGDKDYNDTEPQSLTAEIAKADPKPDIPELAAVKGQTLADVELPEGFAWVDETQSVGDVGENSFIATFTPKDTKNFNTLENLMLTVRVTEPEQEPQPEPQYPEVTPPKAREGLVYDRTEQELITAGSAVNGTMVYKVENEEEQEIAAYDLILPDNEGYSDTIPIGADAGKYKVWYKVIGNEGYNDTEPNSLTVEIAKADPVPPETDLTATVGQTLADVKLPQGFAWVDDTQSVGNAGTNYFPAIYTPADTKNFNTLKLDLPIRVTNQEKPAETTTTTAAASEATTATTAVAETTATQTEITATAATTATEAVTEPASATSPPHEAMEPEDGDKIPNTGIVLILAPFVVSTITAVVSGKRK